MVTQAQSQTNIFLSTCGSRRVLELIADQWTALLIYALESGTKRSGQLLQQIDGISRKMLTQTLRRMERDGLVKRVVYPVVPPIVEYSLTPLGETLIEPVQALRRWAVDHLDAVEESRIEYDQRSSLPLAEQTAALVQQRAADV